MCDGIEVAVNAVVRVPAKYLADYPTDAEKRAAARDYVNALMKSGTPMQCVSADAMPFELRMVETLMAT